jgi:RNA polymerase sigma factor for flagellar operon FliA
MSGRDDLIAEHLNLVDAIARKMARGLPRTAEIEELIGFGRIGLVEAANKYDPAFGCQFKTFAYYRIRGAICDGIRSLTWFTHRVAQRLALEESFDAMSEYMIEEEGERPAAQPLQVQVASLKLTVEKMALACMLSTDDIDAPDHASEAKPVDEDLAERQIHGLLREALEELDPRQRHIIHGVFFDGRTITACGEDLGLSRSWAKRLHDRGLSDLLEICRGRGLCS